MCYNVRNMLRFYDEKNILHEFDESYNVINSEVSPIKEILAKENVGGFYFSLSDDKKVSFKDVSTLQVNINNSSSVFFIFDKADFKKDEIFNQVSTLKDMEVIDYRTSKKKTLALLNIVKEFHPLFFIYVPRGANPLFANEIRYLLFDSHLEDVHSFYIEEGMVMVERPIIKDETKVESPIISSTPDIIEHNEEEPIVETKNAKEKSSSNNFLGSLKKFFKQFGPSIKANKYHFVFIVVSAFLIGFAGTIGIYNSMIGKTIAVLFFLCAIVGATLNTFIFIDYFKVHKVKEALFIDTILFSFLGSIISMLGFIAFYAIDSAEGKENISQGLLIFLNYLLVIGVVAISICIAYFYDKRKKASKKKSN